MATHAIHRPGIDRLEQVVSRKSGSDHAVRTPARSRWIPALMLTGLITLVDIAVLRWFPRLDDGFIFEWIVLWALGLVLVGLFAGLTLKLSRRIVVSMRNAATERRERRDDVRMIEAAQRDPALMAELRAIACRDL